MRAFVELKVGGLPLVDDAGRPAGFVSDGDVMRYLADKHPVITGAYSLMEAARSQDVRRAPARAHRAAGGGHRHGAARRARCRRYARRSVCASGHAPPQEGGRWCARASSWAPSTAPTCCAMRWRVHGGRVGVGAGRCGLVLVRRARFPRMRVMGVRRQGGRVKRLVTYAVLGHFLRGDGWGAVPKRAPTTASRLFSLVNAGSCRYWLAQSCPVPWRVFLGGQIAEPNGALFRVADMHDQGIFDGAHASARFPQVRPVQDSPTQGERSPAG